MDPVNRASLSSAWRWFALAGAVVLADQLTKAMVLSRFVLGERLELTGFFNMVLVYNKGAAFSFLSDAAGWQTPLLIGFALVAIGIVGTLLVRSRGRRLLCSGLALILGGALGNLIDRLRYGQVVDFLDFHAGAWHWPAFNVADSAITIGAALLIIEGFVHHEGRARAAP
ncbi:MAG: lipoprotein signal peptidase [Betaproteobacteria bacterium]|nr:MAG: lipoprotein signal peptidase [Betaproteobacteria bacterium]